MTVDGREARRKRKGELALRALAEHGNPKKAADSLGIVEGTLRKQIADYLTLSSFETVVQAAYWLDRERISA